MMMVVFSASNFSYPVGAGLSFASGYIIDLHSASPMGLNSLSKTIIHYLAYRLTRSLFLDLPLLQGVLVFAGVLLEANIFYLMLKFLGLPFDPYRELMLISLGRGVYSGLLSPLFLTLLRRPYATHYA